MTIVAGGQCTSD